MRMRPQHRAADTGTRTTRVIDRLLVGPIARLLAWAPDVDGRAIVLAAVAAYLGFIASGRLVSGVNLWPYFGVPPGPSLFFDARNLTAAWDCQRLGYDPLYDSPCDPWGRPLNYLRPWLLLGVLGLNQSHTFAFAALLVAAMFVSFTVLMARTPAGTGIVLALAACSPAVMLAVERANMDIAMFSVVTVSVLLWQSMPRTARLMSPGLVLLAATGKLYPIFALPAFAMARSRTALHVSLLCLAVFAVYVAYSADDIVHIARIAPQGQHFAYGARILLAHVYHQIGADHWSGPAALKQLLAAVPLGVAVAALAVRVRRRLPPSCDGTAPAEARVVALHAGALIYLGTFAVGNNFDYRLVFLLLTLPQLAEWARTPTHRLSLLASATLAAIVLLLWIGSLSQVLALWDELASWTVAGLLAALGAATLPRIGSIRDLVVGRRPVPAREGTLPA